MKAITVEEPVRPVIVGALVVCVAVAMAPWLSGGQEPVARLISGAALLLGALLAWRQPQGGLRLKWGPLTISWLVLVLWAVLSLLWSASRYSSVLWLTEWVMAGLAFRLAYAVAGERQGREWLLRAYLASAGAFCVAAVWLYLTNSYPRLTGAFYWPNPAAAYLMPAIVIVVDRVRRGSGWSAYGWMAAGIGLVATFLLTDSRAALIVLVLTLLAYLVIVSWKGLWIRFVFMFFMGFALSIGVTALSTVTAHHSWSLIPGSRLAQVANGEPTSLRDRINYVNSAFEMWWAHPFTGTGAGAYGDVHPQYQQRVESASTDAHNMYVQVLAELGIVGAVAVASVLLWLFVGSIRGLVLNPELMPVALGALALFVHFGLDIDASYPALLMLAAVFSGVVYRQWWTSRGRLSWRWPVIAAVILVPVINLYESDVRADRGQAAQAAGDYGLATADYAAAHRGVAYNPDYVDAEGIDWYAQAAAGGSSARPDAATALRLARQAVVLDPHDGQHYQLEGRVLALTGNWKAAAQAFKEALMLDPYNHPEYALELATAQIQEGNEQAGVRTAQAMLAQYPPAVVADRNLDTTIRPNLADLEALVGNVELQQGNLSGARAAAARALAQDPTSLQGRALSVQLGRHLVAK